MLLRFELIKKVQTFPKRGIPTEDDRRKKSTFFHIKKVTEVKGVKSRGSMQESIIL